MTRKYLRPIEPEAVTFDSSVELVDLKEAAAFLKISVPTLGRMQQQREISFIKDWWNDQVREKRSRQLHHE